MKVSANQVDAFLRQPKAQATTVLVYGPDTGLVQERITALLRIFLPKTADPFALVELTPDRIRTDPALLHDEVAALTFSGNRKVVLLRETGDELAPLCGELLEHWPSDGILLLAAGNLPARSKLRRVYENAHNAAALPCFADEGEGLRRLIGSIMAEHDVRIDHEAEAYLCERLGGDRAVTRSELEKVALYGGPGAQITLADAIACIGDSAAHNQDDLTFAVAAGDYGRLETNLSRLWHENTAAVTIIRAQQRHIHRLLRTRAAMAAGANAEMAMKKLQPPVFWKYRGAFLSQTKQWSIPRLSAALGLLTEAELQAKTTGIPDRAACSRALMATAQLARRRDTP
ncbi:MAG: DNA polymerase III subunit delta [Alphaproteobacteria bacterium]